MSLLNSSSYILDMMVGDTFSYKDKDFLNEHTFILITDGTRQRPENYECHCIDNLLFLHMTTKPLNLDPLTLEPKTTQTCLGSHLPTSFDDFVINVSDHHGVDDSGPKEPGQDPLQDVKPDVRAVTAHTHTHTHTHTQLFKTFTEWISFKDKLESECLPGVTQVGMVVHGGSAAVPENNSVRFSGSLCV